MRRLLLVALLGAALAGPALAQSTPAEESRVAARALVEALGLSKQVDAMLLQTRGAMIAALQQQAPKLPAAQVAELVDTYLMPELRAHSGEIVDATAAIYAGRLTAEEMRQIAEFYATPLGVKLLAMMPEVFAESLRFGQAWGARVTQDAIAKHRDALRARGFTL